MRDHINYFIGELHYKPTDRFLPEEKSERDRYVSIPARDTEIQLVGREYQRNRSKEAKEDVLKQSKNKIEAPFSRLSGRRSSYSEYFIDCSEQYSDKKRADKKREKSLPRNLKKYHLFLLLF
jgi:hypothetical protein